MKKKTTIWIVFLCVAILAGVWWFTRSKKETGSPAKQSFYSETKDNNAFETNPEATKVVEDFFSAFEKSDYEHMKTYCTKECVDVYFHDGDVFGMVWAKTPQIAEKPGFANENEYKIFVTVEMEPAKNSALYGSGSNTSFYVALKKTDSGSWLIDSFATGI